MQPTKLTATLAETIIRAKAAGETHAAAAESAGITERRLRKWIRFGEEFDREPFATFAKAFRRAENAANRKVVAAARRAMDGVLDAA